MENAVIVGVAKGIKSAVSKVASAELSVGTHNIDALVRVRGTVTKGEAYEQIQHMKVDQWGMIAVLLSKVNGVTMESVVREVNGIDKDTITRIKKQASDACDKVKAPAVTMTSGKVTTKLTFNVEG